MRIETERVIWDIFDLAIKPVKKACHKVQEAFDEVSDSFNCTTSDLTIFFSVIYICSIVIVALAGVIIFINDILLFLMAFPLAAYVGAMFSTKSLVWMRKRSFNIVKSIRASRERCKEGKDD